MKFQRSTLNSQLSTLLFAAFFVSPLRAQVVIGNNAVTPRPFSLLEMETTYRKGGLRLPQLTNAQCDSLAIIFTSGGFSAKEAQAAKGLVVYNTGAGCVEYWDAGQWNSLCNDGSIYFTQEGNERILNDIADAFPSGGNTLTLIPHDTQECTTKNPPYTVDVRFGAEYAYATPVSPPETNGKFDLKMDKNTSIQPRIAILRVTDNCSDKYHDFLVFQDGAVCSNPSINSTTGLTQTISQGSNVVMSVTASSSIEPLNYQWYWGQGSDISESYAVGGAQSNVFSTTLSTVGVYYFWCKVSNICGEVSSAMFTMTVDCRPAQPSIIAGDTLVYKNAIKNYWVVRVPGVSYNWTLPAGWTQTAGESTNSITVKVGSSGGTISVTMDNGCGAGTGPARTMPVNVATCGAYTSRNPDVWREFLCWNLGADFSADPFVPSPDLNGDYYHWGQPTPATSVFGIIGAWGSTYNASNIYGVDDFYNDEGTTVKSATDPCPDGYRVPNFDEWSNVGETAKVYNLRTNKGTWLDYPGSVSAWGGTMLGEALFLPAAGSYSATGLFDSRGYGGGYWSSSAYIPGMLPASNAAALYFMYPDDNIGVEGQARLAGNSIRCIKE